MIADLVAGALAGLAVAMPVGAIGSYLVGLAARERLSTAAAAALGVASVDGAYAVVASVGGAGLHHALASASRVLTLLAAIVLVAVAARTLQQAVRRFRASLATTRAAPGQSPRRAYLNLLGMTAINPATVITFVAVVLGRRAASGGVSGSAVLLFAAGAFVASAAWQLLLVGAGSFLGRLLRGRRGQLGIAIGSALLMLGLAGAVLAG